MTGIWLKVKVSYCNPGLIWEREEGGTLGSSPIKLTSMFVSVHACHTFHDRLFNFDDPYLAFLQDFTGSNTHGINRCSLVVCIYLRRFSAEYLLVHYY